MSAFFKLTFISGAALLTIASAIAQTNEYGTVVSGEKQELRTIYVRYGDLNLSSASGVKRLERRVRSAARSICYSRGVRPIITIVLENRCYDTAMDGAEPQIVDAVRRNGTDMAARETVITLHRRAG